MAINSFKVRIMDCQDDSVFSIGVAKLNKGSEGFNDELILGLQSNTWSFNSKGDFYFAGRNTQLGYVFKKHDEITLSINPLDGRISISILRAGVIASYETPQKFADLKKTAQLYAGLGLQKTKDIQLMIL